ncbi:aldolase-type tim barrel [Lucifera butyrica]|uniref:Aldolase-type tim barrel n=1 Tax=Lucifera butyrica TaxID=1351585 RepID=A0A498R2V9_9FIRM|nr:MupG family TIM beta-alpha barrel fold protein [Lucifera butyrica]VBB05157.1 aldolase-type tim barrel [Lucifera butyrica]
MRRLGISVYPGQTGLEEILEYIGLAAKYGFQRVFTCLISMDGRDIQVVIEEFKRITALANQYNMEVIADVEPAIFQSFGVTVHDLAFFHELGLAGIRLDLGFSGQEESIMTFNPYGLKIELNASNGTKYLENILSHQANPENILGCHNFYPHVYTGLSYAHFMKCSRQFKEQGIRTAAFINSQAATGGPWPVTEGLCTLEMHRSLPVEVQAKHLFATGVIDDVMIANAFASEEELRRLSGVDKYMLDFTVEIMDCTPALERKIILEEFHYNRGDVSDFVVRSTQSRVKYKEYDFPLFNTPDIKRGDLLIESSLYKRYAGELQIALRPMPNSGKTNVAGRITEKEIFLLDYLEPWMKFKFTAP